MTLYITRMNADIVARRLASALAEASERLAPDGGNGGDLLVANHRWASELVDIVRSAQVEYNQCLMEVAT